MSRSPDELVRMLSADGLVGVRALVATELVGEAARLHRTGPTATAALGRALMGAVLLASGKKQGETAQLQFRGDGPLGSLTVIADAEGDARGFVSRPEAEVPLRDGRLDVGAGVGRGNLSVVRYHPSWREPYTGVVPLESGEIAEDLARYLLDSEQRPSAVALGVFLESDGSVGAAGGFLIEALPDASEAELAVLELNAHSLPHPSELIRAGARAGDLAERLLDGLGARNRHASPVRYHCPCDRERVTQAARLLGSNDLRELSERGESLEVRCEFCATRYELAPGELRELLPDA